MAYRLSGTYYVSCSCKVGCPCIFGEPEGHDGYCDAQMTVDVNSGEIDGVDVGGVTMALAANWPKGFVSGDGKGRLYFDPSTSAEQRDAFSRAFAGQAGGGELEALGAVIPSWLEPSEASIELDTQALAGALRANRDRPPPERFGLGRRFRASGRRCADAT